MYLYFEVILPMRPNSYISSGDYKELISEVNILASYRISVSHCNWLPNGHTTQ